MFETAEKGHGRLETRRIWTSEELNEYLDFPYCGQVFKIHREFINLKTNQTSSELAYGITSLTPDKANPEQILSLNRGHWSIENRSHWVRDWNFDEDRRQIRTKNGPHMMACLRNFAISLLRLAKVENIAQALRKLWAKPHIALNMLKV